MDIARPELKQLRQRRRILIGVIAAALVTVAVVAISRLEPAAPQVDLLVTNAGGPGVLATDALITGGGQLAAVSDETMAKLNEILPAAWSHGNPIDILGDAGPDRYADAIEISNLPEGGARIDIRLPLVKEEEDKNGNNSGR